MTLATESTETTTPQDMWREHVSLDDVMEFLSVDADTLRNLYQLQALDSADAKTVGRLPDLRIRVQIDAWERAQDAHWSWYKELTDDRNRTAEGLEGLGFTAVGLGH